MDPATYENGVLKPLVPIAETAQLLRISRSKLYSLVEQREIACIRIGSRILFTQELIQRFINQCTRPAGSVSSGRGA